MRRAMLVLGALAVVAAGAAQDRAAETVAELMARGDRARAEGNLDAARQHYERAYRLSPDAPRVIESLADALIELGEVAPAIAMLRSGRRSGASEAPVRRILCKALLIAGESANAVVEARRAVELDPPNVEGRLCFGAAAVADGRYAEAIPALESALNERPADRDALYGLATAYAAVDDPRAEAAYERVLAALSGELQIRTEFVEYLWRVGRIDRGNLEMERTIRDHPQSVDLHKRFGVALFEQSKYLQAANALEAAWRQGHTYELAYLLGNAWWEAGRIDDAVASFSRAIQIDPDALPARHDLGRLLLWAGRPDDALPHLRKAVAARAGSAAVQLDLGRALEATGSIDEAEQAFRAAIELEPGLSAPHYALGRLLVRRGGTAAGRKELARYEELQDQELRRRLEQKSLRAELDLAWADLKRGNTDVALTRFRKLPETTESLVGAAEALSRLGRHAEAIGALERARLLSPEDQKIRAILSRQRAIAQSAR